MRSKRNGCLDSNNKSRICGFYLCNWNVKPLCDYIIGVSPGSRDEISERFGGLERSECLFFGVDIHISEHESDGIFEPIRIESENMFEIWNVWRVLFFCLKCVPSNRGFWHECRCTRFYIDRMDRYLHVESTLFDDDFGLVRIIEISSMEDSPIIESDGCGVFTEMVTRSH